METEAVVTLNVGGFVYVTRRRTLLESNCFFATVAQHNPECTEFFIDRDATHFRYVLNWLRGVRYLPRDPAVRAELLYEADFYSLCEMSAALRAAA